MGRILIAGEPGGITSSMAMLLRADGMVAQEMQVANTVVQGVEADLCDLVIVNLSLSESDAFELIARCAVADSDIPVLAVACENTVAEALKACEKGAFDYLTTPINPKLFTQTLHRWLDQNGEGGGGQSSAVRLQHEFRLSRIIAESPAMQDVCERVLRLGAAEITTSILGESGSGRSAVARALHESSPRMSEPFIFFDCKEESEEKLLGTLGEERTKRRTEKAVLLDAHRGSLYLRNAEHLSARSQAVLLEVINDRVVAVGEGDPVPVDVRFIFSFGYALNILRDSQIFAEELMNRVGLSVIQLPDVQQRRADILPLISLLLQEADEQDSEEYTMSSVGAEMLERYTWPGGMEQLVAMVHNHLRSSGEHFISADALPSEIFDYKALENPMHDDKGPHAYRNLIEFLHGYEEGLMGRLQRMVVS